jgi:DNA-binding transcriptional LysR family regulator
MKFSFSDLKRIDLNLAVVFLALWQERSVTRAAKRLMLSQAAVSAALMRLRATADDPLFVRTRTGMEPTPRARAMAEPLSQHIEQLHGLMLAPILFDSRASRRRFTVGMSDDLELAMGPRLAEMLADDAPNISLVLRQVNRYTVEQAFDERELDLALVSGSLGRMGLEAELLGELDFSCLLAARQTDVPLPLSLEAYVSLPHVLVSPLGRESVVDAALRSMGLQRRIQTALTHFSALPAFLTRLRAVATAPTPTCLALSRCADLQVCRPPLELGRFGVTLLCRRDSAGDRGLDWLKQQFRSVFQHSVGESVAEGR